MIIIRYIRSIFFYLVYSISLVLYSSLCLLVAWMLPIKARYPFVVTWNRFAIWWLKVCCAVNYKLHTQGSLPSHPYVLVSNHQSPWETIYLYYRFQPLCATLKMELLSIPFFGWSLRLLRPIAIDRSKRREARSTLLAQGVERLRSGISVLIFPEGTRVDPGQEKKFSSGAAELAIAAGVDIVPLAHNAGKFWPARRLLKVPGTIEIVLGKPIPTAGREPKELIEEIQLWTKARLLEMN